MGWWEENERIRGWKEKKMTRREVEGEERIRG